MGVWKDRTNQRYGKLICEQYLGDGKWKCLCDCGNETIVTTSALTTGKTKSCGCLRYKYHINEKFFDEINTEQKAYILGLIAADGTINIKNNTIKLELRYNDIDILEKIKKAMDYDFNIIHYTYKSYFKDIDKIYDNHLVRLNITNKHICKKIQCYGIIPNKSKTLDINLELIPQDLFRHFLRGMWDGDGSISMHQKNRTTPQPTINLTTSDIMCEKIYYQLNQDINDFSAHIYCRHKNNSSTKTLLISQKESIKNVLDYLYKDATIFLDRKYKKYLQIKDIYAY